MGLRAVLNKKGADFAFHFGFFAKKTISPLAPSTLEHHFPAKLNYFSALLVYCFLASLVSLPVCPLPATASKRLLSLTEALQYAEKNAPDLANARANVEIAALAEKNAFRAFLPSLDFSTSVGVAQASPKTQINPYTSNYKFTLSERLLDRGTKFTAFNQAKRELELRKLELQEARQKLALEIANTFYSLSNTKYQLDVKLDETKLLNKQFESVNRLYRQGLQTRKDFLRLRTQVQSKKIEILEIENTLQQAQYELRKQIGVPLAEDGIQFQPLKINDKNLIADTGNSFPSLEKHYLYKVAKLTTKISKYAVDNARLAYLPGATLSGSIEKAGSGYLRDEIYKTSSNHNVSWNIALTVDFNLFDWGIRRNNIKSAVRTSESTERTQTNAMFELRKQLSNLRHSQKKEIESYRLSKELFDLEEKSFSVITTEFQNGRTSYLDYIDGINNLSRARVQYYQSYFTLKRIISEKLYHQGKLYEKIMENN